MSANFSVFLCILLFSYAAETQVEAYFQDNWDLMQDEVYVWDQYDTSTTLSRSGNGLPCVRPDFYVCELPPNVGLPESTKTCNLRNNNFQEQVYRWASGHACLFYTHEFLYVTGYNNISMTTGCRYGHLSAPCVEAVKEDGTCGCFPFDPAFKEVSTVVNNSLIPAAHGRWELCVRMAVDCCTDVLIHDTEYPEGYCPSTFDAWTCWDYAPNGTVQSEVCSPLAYSNSGPNCNHFSTKECFANGTWNEYTNYSTCSITPRFERRYRFHVAVLSVSIAACAPAVFVFFFYRRLRVTRVALHRNLLIAIIARNIFVIISRMEVYINELTNHGDTVMSTNSGWCRALAVAERTAANAVFVCMLIEGIYLHRLIVAVFKKHHKMKILYGIGTVITIVPVLAWGIVMGVLNDHSCWVVYTTDHIQWILDVPRICILLINTVLFLDILRVLVTKVRNAENVNQLNTTKVTLFLMPVFGIQFLFTAFRPNTDSCTWEEVYFFVAYSLEGLQGIIVALLYCYINKEVHNLVKATYKKTEAIVSRVGKDSNYYRRSTLGQNTDRRITFSTGLDQSDDTRKDTAPKLQVAEMLSVDTNQRLADVLEPKYDMITTMGISNNGYEPVDISNEKFLREEVSMQANNDYLGSNVDDVSIDSFSSDTKSASEGSFTLNEPIQQKPFYGDTLDVKDSIPIETTQAKVNIETKNENEDEKDIKDLNPEEIENLDSELLSEIMKYVESNRDNVILDPELLAPNRKKDDKIIFVDE